MESVNLDQGVAGTAVGSAYNGGVCPCRQAKHDCRFKSIWRCKAVALHVESMIAILPIIVSPDNKSIGIDNCEYRIAQGLAYSKGTQRRADGAYDDCPAPHVSNNESANKHIIACADETAPADVRQFGVKPRPVNFVSLGQANSLGHVLSGYPHGVGAGGQVCL